MIRDANLIDWLDLLVRLLTPAVLWWAALRTQAYVDRLARLRRFSEVETEWRLDVFRRLLNEFNKVYQYFTYQGGWSSMSPDDVTAAKREADRLVYMNSFLWTAKFLKAYEKYKKVAFLENQGRGRAFLFRGNVERYRENANWSESWKSRFVLASDRVERDEFTKAYREMMDLAVRDLGIVSDTGEEGG